ncbi:uncharacterized protein L969DRAFT_17698 [Mixia osmundae IAM 14324]|uniref:Purine-cytosine permease n=1 Tax=Mixia osmundae (strain CBS 9802 / IAM 14324 / JCM 22182 / KY 12970) TaxID=764103 RepID=G7DYY0_MIXOS|nr:uncharacterized protein L969DRAFT_17698 [Mixia osmundae IAM 14324]KEI38622.1 hypothetical protein L969DRAFT_17698 [Mixia osmundae IAM 14324]GAA95790.1 hypothetical protein E5Q_02447 [Mixia osmundae IAM 14324]
MSHSEDEKMTGTLTPDMEKTPAEAFVVSGEQADYVDDLNDHVPRKTGPFAPLWRMADRLRTAGVETRGIERVPPTERQQKHVYDLCTMWLAADTTISTFALGMLGSSVFFLGFKEATLVIIFFNLLCTIPVAMFSVWGARLGLRQLCLSRFSFGRASLAPVVLNCIACVGWSTINAIAGAQCLRAVSDTHRIPVWAAVVIIAIITLVVSFMGYRVVHIYEKWSWIPVAIIFFIVFGEAYTEMSSPPFEPASRELTGSILSFGAAIAGFALGWTSLAADYSVQLPEDTSAFAIFAWTYAGLNVPLILVETLGAAMMTTITANADWNDRYLANGSGGLLSGPLSKLGGFGQFLLVILALSIVANNIPNMYSLSLTFQTLGPYAQAIPRPFITLLGTIIYIVLGIVGYSHFETALDTLLVLLSYWLACFTTVLLAEHYVFRGGKFSNYEADAYGDWSILPMGLAGTLAIGAAIAGAVVGMSTVWYVGRLALDITAPYGGDLGFELSCGFSLVAFIPMRYIEKRYIGR